MPTINVNTAVSLPAGALLMFKAGGSGRAIDVVGNIYSIGLSDMQIGPFPKAQTVQIQVANAPITYAVELDGVPFNPVEQDPYTRQLVTADGQVVGDVESALQRYGAVLNGTADDTAALQETINWFAATYPRSVLRFPNMANQRARLASTLFIDMAKTAIDFSQLELRPAAGVTALQLTGTDEAVHPQAAMFLQNFHIVGPGRDIAGTRGIFHHNPDGVLMGKGASRYALRNFSISQCDIGEEYGNTAWGIGHYGWSIFEFNTAGIRVGAGYPDGYELPVYYGGALLNGINGIDLQRGQLTFIGSSLDYIRKFGTIQNGRVHLIGCHQETNQRRASYPANHVPWTISNNGSLLVKGGRLVMSDGTPGDTMMTHWVENNNTSVQTAGYAMFDSVSMQNVDTSSKYLAKGTGAVYARRCVVEINGGKPLDSIIKGLHESRNIMQDGGFEAAAGPNDDVFVRGGTVTTRLDTSSVGIVRSTSAARNGTNGLRITKKLATNTAGAYDIYVLKRVRDAANQYSGVIRFKSPDSTGDLIVDFGFFEGPLVTAGPDIVPAANLASSVATLNASSTVALTTDWQERHVGGSLLRPPAGFNWVGWRIRVHNLAQNANVDIDDVEIHEF